MMSRKLLGFFVSQKGIDSNPENVKAITNCKRLQAEHFEKYSKLGVLNYELI